MASEIKTGVVVIGAGPGGYTAAFRLADLGQQVVLIEKFDSLGGVCLNVGCIPSKSALHAAKVITDTTDFASHGITFPAPVIDLEKLRTWIQTKVVQRLTGGLKILAKQRKIQVIKGVAKFISPQQISVETDAGPQIITFENVIIATGSRSVKLPFLPDDPRIIDSTGALEFKEIPKRMLVIGGGIIGLEMATVYDALGSKISVVELTEGLLPGVDKDIVAPLQKRIQKRYENIWLQTKVTKVEAKNDGLWVSFEGANAPTAPERFDYILSAVGRIPNGKNIDADKAGIHVDERGFIPVDKQQRTNVAHVFAIGDVAGNPMLAHKAMPEGKVAAEVIAGKKHYFEPRCIPSVAYTDPEVAWVGVTETEAKAKNLNYEKAVFPWVANGRALSLGREEGLTKLIFDKETHRILGGAIVGVNAGDLISELSLAIEMGCEAEDISLTIHPHPTLSETIPQATEIFEGTITDLYMPKK
jgi:dihydrolipoamide dehydrogenase